MSPKTNYQSFDGTSGASRSAAKLEAIGMPEDLTGARVLDLGCNEGFFCQEALRRGASEVIGLDADAEVIEHARERVPGASFRAASWWDLPDGRFDLILFLSAIHYEPRPKAFLEELDRRLAPGGLLILECGVAPGAEPGRVWTERKGITYHPNWALLSEQWLAPFEFRHVGPSVPQSNDPVDRHVIHCRGARPTVLIVDGPRGSGRATVARHLRHRSPLYVRVDEVLERTLTVRRQKRRLYTHLQAMARDGVTGVADSLASIEAAGLEREFAQLLVDHVEPDVPLVVIEGNGLGAGLLDHIVAGLDEVADVWVMTPASSAGPLWERSAGLDRAVRRPSRRQRPAVERPHPSPSAPTRTSKQPPGATRKRPRRLRRAVVKVLPGPLERLLRRVLRRAR